MPDGVPFLSGPPDPTVTPAATVIPIRDSPAGIEVLLLRRNSRGPFGGMWVFPGGKVDPGDLEAVPADAEDAEIAGARLAAVREAAEEAALSIDPSGLVTLSFWVPPPEAQRRFATWFFLAAVPADAEAVVVDLQEIRDHDWMTPARAIERCDAGEIELAPPTFTTLWWLRDRPDTATALADAGSRPPERFATHVAFQGDVLVTMWDGDVAYDGGELDRPGRRRRLVMQPGAWRVEIQP